MNQLSILVTHKSPCAAYSVCLHTNSLPCLCSRKQTSRNCFSETFLHPWLLVEIGQMETLMGKKLRCLSLPTALLWFWQCLHPSWATGPVGQPPPTVPVLEALTTPSLTCPCRPRGSHAFILSLVLWLHHPCGFL